MKENKLTTVASKQDGEICRSDGLQKNTQCSVEATGTWLISRYNSMKDGVFMSLLAYGRNGINLKLRAELYNLCYKKSH
jgi:hypothetical protein